jgi:hypothetical protein
MKAACTSVHGVEVLPVLTRERHGRRNNARPLVEVEATAGVSEHEDWGGVLFQLRVVLLEYDGPGDEALVRQEGAMAAARTRGRRDLRALAD